MSAKTGENVEDAFSTLVEKLHENNVKKYKEEILQIRQIETNNKKTCKYSKWWILACNFDSCTHTINGVII